MTFNPKLALITGASRGIGAAIARKLAQQGYSVILIARDAVKLRAFCDELKAKGAQAFGIPADVADLPSVTAALAKIRREIGTPGVLVNNAGLGGPFHRVDEVSEEEWDLIFATNIKSVYRFCKELLPEMKKHGFGRIVNIASIQGLQGAARSSTYVASKHAVVGYTKSIAVEWGEFGITCNAVCPGYIATEMTATAKGDPKMAEILRNIPAGRLGTPDEVAAVVALLVSGESGYFNGSALVVDGGHTAQVPG